MAGFWKPLNNTTAIQNIQRNMARTKQYKNSQRNIARTKHYRKFIMEWFKYQQKHFLEKK